ncbi:MAG TPA: DUF1549 domain-containing protein, partial [Planctomycetota bacterium]|nr:DUF1549 domain-containing protein [Planctomycetota bacterium]
MRRTAKRFQITMKRFQLAMKQLRAAIHLGAALVLAGPLAGGEDVPRDAWWSLKPIVRPPIPADPTGWARTPIDAFVLEELHAKGLEPSSEADRRTLIRRLFFDVHGLPPSPVEVEAFVTDPSPSAYEELVERLLASPRHGERWGRHWLDLVHYGESHGYDKDKRRPNAWPYRDYVIRALNEDRPYTRFIEEQVAGDVLYPAERDAVLATGFIAAGPWDFVGHVELREGTMDKDIARLLDRDDMVATAMSTFTSVTAHCARCHDHKFDPIPQEDYYRLQAVFAGVDRADRPYDADPAIHRARSGLLAERKALGEKLAALEAAARKVTDPGTAALDQRIVETEARIAKAAGGKSPSNGYHSGILPGPDAVRWVEVDLGRIVALERVVLHPARPTDFPDTPGFGFPARFRVEVSERPLDEGAAGGRQAIEDHTAADFPNPGDAAHVIPTGGTRARFIRVTATRLWERTADFVFALAELEAFEGGANAALGASVRALDSIEAGRWGKERLVDGWSSRDRIAAGPAESAGLTRIELQMELGRLRAARAAIVQSLLDEATRSAIEETAARLDAASQALGALPPQAMVYAAASEFDAQGSFTRAVGPRPVHLLHRGEVKNRGELMAPG